MSNLDQFPSIIALQIIQFLFSTPRIYFIQGTQVALRRYVHFTGLTSDDTPMLHFIARAKTRVLVAAEKLHLCMAMEYALFTDFTIGLIPFS